MNEISIVASNAIGICISKNTHNILPQYPSFWISRSSPGKMVEPFLFYTVSLPPVIIQFGVNIVGTL